MGMNQSQKTLRNCLPIHSVNVTSQNLLVRRGPPYLAYIISGIPQRYNSTLKQLNDALPDFFRFHHKQPVPHNDSRILRTGDMKVSSLLLTFIDLWNDIGSRPAAQLHDDEWVFFFEDDVGIVPSHIMKSFYSKIYEKWNYGNPNPSLASRLLI